jgi:putative transposase
LDRYAYENSVTLDFSRPSKPTDNSYVENFNRKFLDDYLSVNWFLSLNNTRMKINEWEYDYNFFRPNSSLDDLTPEEFIDLHSFTPEFSSYIYLKLSGEVIRINKFKKQL